MRPLGRYIATARSDAEDRLIEAGEPLATLQRRSGGEIPGTIATPSILELVRRARQYGLRLAQTVHAQDDQDAIIAWIEVSPAKDGEGGCDIALANWQTVPLPDEDAAMLAVRKTAIDHLVSEFCARLDSKQNLLTVDGSAPELGELIDRMRGSVGQPWTDFVEVEGMHHHQPLHWRLLDGAKVKLEGSARSWTASFVPLGGPEAGSAGFELYLIANEPPPSRHMEAQAESVAQAFGDASVGREIAPVLRHPISRIIANAGTIRSRLAGPIAEEYSNYAADIAAAGEHLLTLIEDLTDVETVEAEDFTTAPDLVDLADIARRAVGMLSGRAKERGIKVDGPDHDESLPAIGEYRRILQILLNLIGNAIRYSPEGSSIWVRVLNEGDRASLTIADQGQGLSAEEQQAVFEKFERLGRSGDGGSGLGLYISRKLARAMGGDLTVESAKGTGARFTLTLKAQLEA